MRKSRAAFLAFVSIAILIFFAFQLGRTRFTWKTENAAELRAHVLALEQADLTLKRGSFPWRWDASAFFSTAFVNQTLHALIGLEGTPQNGHDIFIKILTVDFTPGLADNTTELSFEVRSAKVPGLKAYLGAKGALVFKDIEMVGSPAIPTAKFGIQVDQVDPQVRLTDYFSVAARGFASEIISRKIVEHFAGQIDIPFKLVLPKHLNLAIDRNLEVPVDNNRAKLQFKIKLDGDDVQTPITFPVPIETKQGLWLLASLSSAGIDSPDSRALPTSVDALQAKEKTLFDALLPQLTVVEVSNAEAGVWIGSGILDRLLDAVNQLSASQRTVQINLTSGKATIAEKSDKEFGLKGGYEVAVQSATASLQLGPVQHLWVDEKGMQLQIQAKAHAETTMDLHIDPYIGGGFPIDGVKLVGDAPPPSEPPVELQGILGLGAEKTDLTSAILFGPVVKCTPIALLVDTGGSLKFGVRLGVLLGDKPLKPTILVDSLPHYLEVQSVVPKDFALSPTSEPFIRVRVFPKQISLKRRGYWITLNADISRQAAAPTKKELDRQRDAAQAVLEKGWDNTQATDCPEKPPLEVLLAGKEFGPSNEIVKALKLFGEALLQSGHNLSEGVSRLETVLKDPSKTSQVISDVGKSIKNEAKRTPENLRKARDTTKHNIRKHILGKKD